MQHIIRKQVIELRVQKDLDAFDLQHKISQAYWNEVIKAISQVFDLYTEEHEIINLDFLEIDLGILNRKAIDESSWIEGISEKIAIALKAQLDIRKTDTGIVRISKDLSVFQQWLFYMEHGFFPWNTTVIDADWERSIVKTLESDREQRAKFLNLIKTMPQVILRLVIQHNQKFLTRLLEAILSRKQQDLNKLVVSLSGQLKAHWQELVIPDLANERKIAIRIWYLVLSAVAEAPLFVSPVRFLTGLVEGKKAFFALEFLPEQWTPELTPVLKGLEQLLKRLEIFMPNSESSEALIKSLAVGFKKNKSNEVVDKELLEAQEDNPKKKSRIKNSKPEKENCGFDQLLADDWKDEPFSEVIDADGVFVTNAGIVLLHPFLSTFYGYMDLLEDQKMFKSLELKQKAVMLMHYLATGDTNAPEFELTIAKILCNYPANLPMDTIYEFNAQDRSECESLLLTVIEQWGVLKGSSMAALQEDFLQRGGHLFKKNDQLHLRIESRSIDMLLDYIPWTRSMIKLPWMSELLCVEWR